MHITERNSIKSSNTIRQLLHSKNKGSYENDFVYALLINTPPSNFVYEDLIEIVKDDVGNIGCSYIISTKLLEGGKGWNKENFALSPKILSRWNHKSQYIL